MKKIEDYSWDQLNSFRYDYYPYRLVVVSPLSNLEITQHFNEFISDEVKNGNSFEKYIRKTCHVPAIAAIFHEEKPTERKALLFATIATTGERMRLYNSIFF